MNLSAAAFGEVGHVPCQRGFHPGKGTFEGAAMNVERYRWVRQGEPPECIELVDTVANRPIAKIMSLGRKWQWRRETSLLLHGAPPAEGTTVRLTDAKKCVLTGLPDAAHENVTD
jgi:hypothetical protein